MTRSSSRSSYSDRSTFEREQAVVVEAADRDQLGVGVTGRVVEVRWFDDAVGPPLDHRVGDHPADDVVGVIGIDVRPNSMRRPVAADVRSMPS